MRRSDVRTMGSIAQFHGVGPLQQPWRIRPREQPGEQPLNHELQSDRTQWHAAISSEVLEPLLKSLSKRSTAAPVPKSTCACSPGAHSIRRKGNGRLSCSWPDEPLDRLVTVGEAMLVPQIPPDALGTQPLSELPEDDLTVGAHRLRGRGLLEMGASSASADPADPAIANRSSI